MRLNALADVGGVNSINNFARSWQRAAGFHEVTPNRPALVLAPDNTEQWIQNHQYSANDEESGDPRTSLLRQHFAEYNATHNEGAVAEDDDATPRALAPGEERKYRLGSDMGSMRGSYRGSSSIFAAQSHLDTPLAGSYGTSYGTLRSHLSDNSMIHAGRLWREQQEMGGSVPENDRAPLLVKEVEQDGKIILVVEGQSTFPQTIFNATNVLIGVGILSLPMAMKYAGWVCGTLFLAMAAAVTAYTAKLLGKCMETDNSLITYADLAFISFGQRVRIAVSVLFCLELWAAGCALIILFADTLDLLIPGIGNVEWKIICGIIMIPLNFVPLHFLSFSSILGIFSCFSIVGIIIIDGFIKGETPGSLREPATTYLFPSNWLTLPIALGLLMAPFGGHSVINSIYRDMRHTHKFSKAVTVSFSFTYILDAMTAVSGYLMYGNGVLDSITSNIIGTEGLPRSLTLLISVFIAIIPLTKLPLNVRPIVATLDAVLGLDARVIAEDGVLIGMSAFTRGVLKVVVRVVIIILLVITAVIFPSFDSIMAFMGSAMCFTICVILPVAFYLKIFGTEIKYAERVWCWFLIVTCSIMAVTGTVFALLPKSWIGAE